MKNHHFTDVHGSGRRSDEVVHVAIQVVRNTQHRYGANEAGAEGSVQHAAFTLNGQEFICIDSNAQHAFTFTPSISLYVRCNTEEEIDTVFAKLAQDGQIFMPLDRYPFSRKFGWLSDRFGVSWQLNLEGDPSV